MTRAKTIFTILIFLSLAYTGWGYKSFQMKEGKMGAEKTVENEQCCSKVAPREVEVLGHIFEG